MRSIFAAGVAVQVGAFGQVLAQQPVRILVAAALPGRVRVGEVDLQPGGLLDAGMLEHLVALIPVSAGAAALVAAR